MYTLVRQLLSSSNLFLSVFLCFLSSSSAQAVEYPNTKISNQHIEMKLYLPDLDNEYYRATRFDWSGIIYSLKYKEHEYFGEWKSSHDPKVHEDITGPVESFGSLGYDEADPGDEFIRIGVGALEKIDEPEYTWNYTYDILDHGTWEVDQGKDWIEFQHELSSEAGWGYIYTKRIELNEAPGFSIIHTLMNTGQKTIETDQYNHNFFVIDNQITGPDFEVQFPFDFTTNYNPEDIVKLGDNTIGFKKELSEVSVRMELKGYGAGVEDHQIKLVNKKTGAGVLINGDKPLHRLVFWATNTTVCPENFIFLKMAPENEETWIYTYTLFSER